MIEGFLVVDKDAGMTSHDVVARVRRATGVKKCGHAGTLDPMATGVVIIAIGRVTRLIRFLQDLPKEYLATARFGIATDSLDADGTETDRRVMHVTRADLEGVVPEFTGPILQVPPMVSALKKDGRRLYDLARAGTEITRDARPVHVHSLEIVDVGEGEHPDVSFRVVCGKGTYVRSLADDIARRLGGFAHLVSLRRTRVGRLGIEGAAGVDLDDWRTHMISPLEALADYPKVDVSADQAALIVHGRPVELEVPAGVGHVRAAFDGRLLAMMACQGSVSRSEVVLA
jgi:tRNA pseudouridine55 synthase